MRSPESARFGHLPADEAIDALRAVEFDEIGDVGPRRCDALAVAETQEGAVAHALRQLGEHTAPESVREIDEDVSAEDDMHRAEDMVRHEVVLKEHHVPLERL